MKRTFQFLCLSVLMFWQTSFSAVTPISNQPDSVYLFSYATNKNSNMNGLHLAWSTEQKCWTSISPEMRFLFSDYGRWGVEIKVIGLKAFNKSNIFGSRISKRYGKVGY